MDKNIGTCREIGEAAKTKLCLKGVLKVCEMSLEGISKVPGICLEAVWKVSGRGKESVWKVSRRWGQTNKKSIGGDRRTKFNRLVPDSGVTYFFSGKRNRKWEEPRFCSRFITKVLPQFE